MKTSGKLLIYIECLWQEKSEAKTSILQPVEIRTGKKYHKSSQIIKEIVIIITIQTIKTEDTEVEVVEEEEEDTTTITTIAIVEAEMMEVMDIPKAKETIIELPFDYIP